MDETSERAVGGITVAETGGTTVAYLWGEIDEALREQASSAMSRALTRDLPVVLDAGEVTFIDSTGIAFLIQFLRVGREEGLPVTLRNAPPLVTDVLQLLGLEDLFDAAELAGGAVGGEDPVPTV
ncbi:STAS domain-containing protein [Actinotalea ferrariae]|uniref:STAS domain-containing protein n=1 Tax=Actinotalea ferrariae TaxID=1386098 RepID=UPI001C8C7C8B|nr:STAS domain-containing protein [Actinotalea ferrariae]MBX9243402.1 STAS domain-containing protein [Actinotalea ferrariae]